MKKLILLILFAGCSVAQTVHSNTLNWTPGIGGDPITGFIIQRASPCTPTPCTGPGTFTTLVTTTTPNVLTYVDSTVIAGNVFYYQVLAYNSGGNSSPSNVVEATSPFLPPTAPSSLQVVSK